jgi:PRC-barrel domain
MRFKSFALGGAAFIGLIAISAPAIAYTHHPATPAEQKQTDDLNAQSLATAQTGSQQATAQAPQTAMATSGATTTGAPPSAAPTADVGQEKAAAPSPQDSGQPQASNTPSQTKMAMAGSAAQAGAGRVSLDAVQNSSQTLANASVETNDGQAVGAVQKVVTDGSGKPQTVDIALLGSQSKTVAIDATQLSYDQQRNVVVAQLTADQIHALPSAPQG